MQVELYLPQEGENPMDDRSVAFVLEGGTYPGAVPELRDRAHGAV